MRISAALVVAACASARPVPEAAPAEACASYGAAVRAPLARMGAAADRFGDSLSMGPDVAARASRQLAATLDSERGTLAAVEPARADIAAAHDRMVAAVSELANAMRFIGDALTVRDEARREPARTRLRIAEGHWREAVAAVKNVCP